MAIVLAVVATGLASARVQAEFVSTNIIYNFTLALTGVQQGTIAAVPVRIGNKDVLFALDGLVNDGTTNHFVDARGNPANGAKLILDLDKAASGLPVIKVRQVFNRTNIVDTGLSPWLGLSTQSHSTIGGPAFTYAVLGVSLTNGTGAAFSAQGFFTAAQGALIGTGKSKGVRMKYQTTSGGGSVAGDGNLPIAGGSIGPYSLLHGTIGQSGAVIEAK